MHFMALPNDMCTSTLKAVTPTRLFADGLGDNEDSVDGVSQVLSRFYRSHTIFSAGANSVVAQDL